MIHGLQTRPVLNAVLLAAAVTLSATAGSVRSDDVEAINVLRQRAELAERDGRTNDALRVYAVMAEREPACAQPVMLRMVDLYVASREAGPALAWAARAAVRQPVPHAYLAEVHARLGQLKEAELLVRETLRTESDPRRRVPLLWQLAELQVRRGELQAGAATLVSARASAPDDATKAQCERRLAAVRGRAAARQPVQAEVAP